MVRNTGRPTIYHTFTIASSGYTCGHVAWEKNCNAYIQLKPHQPQGPDGGSLLCGVQTVSSASAEAGSLIAETDRPCSCRNRLKIRCNKCASCHGSFRIITDAPTSIGRFRAIHACVVDVATSVRMVCSPPYFRHVTCSDQITMVGTIATGDGHRYVMDAQPTCLDIVLMIRSQRVLGIHRRNPREALRTSRSHPSAGRCS
jgi:hypothetical protein